MSYLKLLLMICFGFGSASATAASSLSAQPLPMPQVAAAQAAPANPPETGPDWAWWGALSLVPVGVLGGVWYGVRRSSLHRMPQHSAPATIALAAAPTTATAPLQPGSDSGDPVPHVPQSDVPPGTPVVALARATATPQTTPLAAQGAGASTHEDASPAVLTPTTRLTKVDRVVELVRDLHHAEASHRRKAIWELGQQGDSRAIQPLVELLADSDSQQRSLILAAVSEIAVRSLKPLHRALLVSLQDDSTDVRKNAIRDVARVYDLMTQLSQLVQHALSDGDPEVQETAQWALTQLNRLRASAAEARSPVPTAVAEAPEPRTFTAPDSRSGLQS